MSALRPLVLVIAQSARFLAQQAAREGYLVRAVDQFNDVDLVSVCEQTLTFADFNQLNMADIRQSIVQLAGDTPATLIAGTGAEVIYPLFNQLPPQITLANNTASCFHQCHSPQQWFALLQKLQIPHPQTCFEKPASSDKWVFKPASRWGGTQIQLMTDIPINKPGFYQRLIKGQAFSVLFFADRNGWQWLSTQSQQPLPDRFIHEHLRNHFPLTPVAHEQVTTTIEKLTQTLQLRGFNSVDFILSEQLDTLLLELNPRPAASMQFLDSQSLISAQIRACVDDKPASIASASLEQTLIYLFASQSGHVREHAHWPDSCHDIPATGQSVEAGDIICSALISTTDEFEDERATLKQQVMLNIIQ